MSDEDSHTLRRIKKRLLSIKQAADGAIEEIARSEEIKAVKWKCSACGHAKHFTKAVTAVACESCPKCNGKVFEPVPL